MPQEVKSQDLEADDFFKYDREHPDKDVEIEAEATRPEQARQLEVHNLKPRQVQRGQPKRSMIEQQWRDKGRCDHFQLKKKAEGKEGGKAKIVH